MSISMSVKEFLQLINANLIAVTPFSCAKGSQYFHYLSECVPLVIAGTPQFTEALQLQRVCHGANINSSSALEALHFCTVISEGLNMTVLDISADYSSLHDAQIIEGKMLRVIMIYPCLSIRLCIS